MQTRLAVFGIENTRCAFDLTIKHLASVHSVANKNGYKLQVTENTI